MRMTKLMNVYAFGAALLLIASTAGAQQKIGNVDSQSVFSTMPEAKTVSATLETLQKTKQTEIQALQTQYTTKYNAAVAKNKALTNANREAASRELEAMGAELQTIKRNIDLASEKAQQELVAKQGELMTPLQLKFIGAVKAVAKEKGIAYVFDSGAQGANNMLAWQDGIDLTAAVKAKLGITAKAPVVAKKS